MDYADNRQPNSPTSPSPADGTVDQSAASVQLSWSASDPDGHSLKYDIFACALVEDEEAAFVPVATKVSETTYELTGLQEGTQYLWTVVATDGQAIAEGPVGSFTTGSAPSDDWTEATAAAPWTGRQFHTSVVHDSRIWIIGGLLSNGSFVNDVWYSSDGVNWTQATASAPWAARGYHASVVYDGKMWIMGGYTNSYKNDVWYSSDGANWTQATASAPWSARGYHASVIHDSKMWIIGGNDAGNVSQNDIWYSSNGTDWVLATASAPWSARYTHTSVVYDNKMWIIGGNSSSYKMMYGIRPMVQTGLKPLLRRLGLLAALIHQSFTMREFG
jgi:elongation factor P hydroxylase